MSINSLGYRVGKNPIAQSFFVDEPSGYFATKIALFFKSTFTATADLQLPVSLHLRPMRNGVPSDTEIVPGSTVYVNHNAVNTSDTGAAATNFEFEEPIYLNGLTDYAIVVYAEAPEYEVFISEIDGQIIGSASARVNRNPNLGSLFYSQNGATFTADQKQDLKFELFRADFITNTTGTALLENATVPRKLLNSNSIRTFADSDHVRVFSTNHGLQVNDTVSISGALAVGGFSADSINKNHTITKIDASGFEFDMASNADSDEIGGGTRIEVTNNIPYSLVWPTISLLKPSQTNVYSSFKGLSGKSFAGGETPYTEDALYRPIQINKNNVALDHNYVIAADSIAETEIGVGKKSANMKMEFFTTNSLVSPMVDLQRSSLVLVDNIIDKQDSAAVAGFNQPLVFVNETDARDGSHAAKHITIPVQLQETAVGLKVLLTANRPKATNFDLYFRTAQVGDNIRELNYTKAVLEANMPSDENPRVFRQYEYLIGGQNGTIDAFTQFQLKIVMTSTNSAKVPVFKDLRAIALSV